MMADRQPTRKKRILQLLLLLFVFLGVCTYLSGQIYYALLPQVQTANSGSGSIASFVTLEGYAHYPNGELVSAPGTLQVEKVYAFRGNAVSEKKELASFTGESIRRAIYDQQNQVEQLKNQRAQYGKSTLDYELVQEQLTKAQEQLDQLLQLQENDGVLYAPAAGQLGEVFIQEGAHLEQGAPIARICQTDTVQVVWTTKDVRQSVTQLRATVLCQRENKSPAQESVVLNLSGSEYQPQENTMKYWAQIQYEDTPYLLYEGEPVSVTMTSNGGDYDFVFARSAVHFTDDANGYVFLLKSRKKLFGTEYYVVKESVTVLNQNEESVALEAHLQDPVVISSTQALEDQMVVKTGEFQ